MVDRERVQNLILAGEGYVADVRRFQAELSRDRFVADRGEQYRLEFPLQQAIQICADIAAHLLAGEPGQRPGTLAGVFDVLADRGLLERSLARRLAAMARFRNLLVHQYADIDADRVWDIITDNLPDVDAFLRHVTTSIAQEGEDHGTDESRS